MLYFGFGILIVALVVLMVIFRKNRKEYKKFLLRRREQEVLQAQIGHAQKMEAIGQLAGGVAHDFNNVLAGIHGAAEVLAIKIGDNKELRRYSEIILQACERASHLTSQLLVMARDKDKDFHCFKLNGCVEETVCLLEHALNKKIRIEMALEAKEDGIRGDVDLVQNLLLNLGFNARDAMPDGGVLHISTRNCDLKKGDLTASWLKVKPGNYVELCVADTGCGIAKELQPKIFEPFFTTKDIGKGTGLGLPAVYGIAREHKAALTVDSEAGQGSMFKVYFPVEEYHAESVGKAPEAGRLKAKILVVDDEAMLRELLGEILQLAGAEVVCAENGKQAVEIYQSQKNFDAVMLDVIMPEMSGTDVYYKLLDFNPDLKAVFMSGYTKDEVVTELVKRNPHLAFIDKPYKAAEVVKKMGLLLAKQ